MTVGPLEGLGYILAPLIAAALGSLFTAAITAYAIGLLVAAAVEALAVSLVFAAAVRPKDESHWIVRPLSLALVGTLAACAALYLTGWLLLDERGEVSNFVLPFVPAALAGVVAFVSIVVLALRALAGLRAPSDGPAAKAKASGRRALRAVLRLAASLVFAAGLLFFALMLAVAYLPRADGSSEEDVGAMWLTGAIGLLLVAGPAAGLAYAGRRRPLVA